MCLAIIGKIKEIKGQMAKTDIDGITKKINVSLVDIKVGDPVLIHAGFAIEKISAQEAGEIKNDFNS